MAPRVYREEDVIMPDIQVTKSSNSERDIPERVDTVIVGNGPAALLLSFLLHGHVPYYCPDPPHPDPILHAKLVKLTDNGRLCLRISSPETIEALTNHFWGSRLSYSTQALPVNVLLDTLVRPNADTACGGEVRSRLRWEYEPGKAVKHVVVGHARRPGGQWAVTTTTTATSEGEKKGAGGWDVETLSYAEMLSLPGWTFGEFYTQKYGRRLAEFTRPTQREVSEYFAAYPAQVGIEEAVYSGVNIDRVVRLSTPSTSSLPGSPNFEISTSTAQTIHSRNVVLASGIFSHPIPPPPLLSPLLALPNLATPWSPYPHLVIGSGFSAADTIISLPPQRKVLHLFRWLPETRPSPLRGCHQQAYPEYAAVYRQMKTAALANAAASGGGGGRRTARRGSVSPVLMRRCSGYFARRDWETSYEGLPNTEVVGVRPCPQEESTPYCTIDIRLETGEIVQRNVSGLSYVVGRRGSLSYLAPELRAEVFAGSAAEAEVDARNGELISGQTLRGKVARDLEVASHVFVVGSLAGDSLVRFAVGGCVYAAGKIFSGAASSASLSATMTTTTSGAAEWAAGRGMDVGKKQEPILVTKGVLSGCGGLTGWWCKIPEEGEEEQSSSSEAVGGKEDGDEDGTPCCDGDAKPTNRGVGVGVNGAAHTDLHIDRRRRQHVEENGGDQPRDADADAHPLPHPADPDHHPPADAKAKRQCSGVERGGGGSLGEFGVCVIL